MHIAWLGKKSPFCGNVTYSREITNALVDRGHRVSFLHYDREGADAPPSISTWRSRSTAVGQTKHCPQGWADCPEVSLPYLYKSTYVTIPSPRSSKVLVEALQELQPDLVHASAPLSPLDLRVPEICRELELPLIATFHIPFDGKRLNFTSGTQLVWYQVSAPSLANCDRTIVFSQIQRDLLVRLGVPAERVAIVPNGVDALKYSPGPSNVKQEFDAERLFVYQGRISMEKNVESLLKAWKQLDMGPNSKLLIVGDGPLAQSLMASYGAEHGIIWLGYVADEQRRIEILRGADVFILPSFVEGLSLSLLEAMSCGLACLATDAGADGEAIEDGAGVILKTSGVTTQLQTLLPLCRDHPELTNLLGYKARQRVLERYTLNKNITQLECLYAEVMQQGEMELNSSA